MKKAENLKSAILLLVATGVAIGLLSSTAVKLASATNLLKQTESLGFVQNGNDEGDETTTEETTEATTEDAGATDATTPSGDNGGNSGNSGNGGNGGNSGDAGTNGDNGGGSGGSGGSDSSGGGILDTIMGLIGGLGDIDLGGIIGGLGGGEEAPEETPEDAPVDNGATYMSIMTSYKAVTEKAKLNALDYTKTTERSIEWNFINDLFIGKVGNITVNDEQYFNNEVTVSGVTNKDPSFIINNRFACLIDTLDEGAVDEAVKSATKTTLEDGNTKIVIVFNDEANPAALGYTDTDPEGFISSVLPVLSADQIKALFNEGISAGLTDVTVTYTDCSVEVVYNPATGDIISLVQVINYDVDASGTKSFSTTITEINTYTF